MRISSAPNFDFEGGEVINIDKPAGLTSFRVVDLIRRWTRCKKVGHAGTLDPLATGVLLICTGRATKRVQEFVNTEKEYEGIIELGKTSQTDDAEGPFIDERQVPPLTGEQVEDALRQFVGSIEQVPPMFSAIKKNGRRLYKLARKGQVVNREPRQVTVHEIALCHWESPFIHCRVRCSKGTYIRALARDVGEVLGTGAYLKELRRTRVGKFHVSDSYALEQFRDWFSVNHASI